MRRIPLKTIILIAAYALSTYAAAHPGHEVDAHGISFMDGLLHPLTGLDHLAAMLAVGLWSALSATSARRIWLAPVAFAGMLLVGALLGLNGLALPAVEPMIAASLLVMGLLVATRAKLPLAVTAGVVGVFAVFHGIAHGTELAGGGTVLRRCWACWLPPSRCTWRVWASAWRCAATACGGHGWWAG